MTSFALVIAAMGLGVAVRAEEDVPLYTNADLERMFGKPPKTEPAKPYANTETDWQRVESFLDREYARLAAQRQYDGPRMTEAPEENPYRGTPTMAWYGGYGYGYYGYPGGYHGHGHRPKTPTLFTPTPPASGRELRTPLHGTQFRIKSGGFRGYAR
jgi:hypothetical protein